MIVVHQSFIIQQPSVSYSAKGISASLWKPEETNALIEFMALNNLDKWSCTKDENFWKCAADFVQQRSQQLHSRTGMFVMSFLLIF